MLTDWLIYLDLLEENNYNTTFLRLITPITFNVIETHYYNYSFGSGYGYSNGNGYGSGYGDGEGYGYGSGNGYRFDYVYIDLYDEEH